MLRSHYLIFSCLFALAIYLPGIDWGLPSRNIDRQLFGDRTPWTGEEILALLESDDATISQNSSTRGADVDANPILDRSQPIVVNATDRQRAEIIQRYRLMSRQPDEFIQFKSLAEMAGRDGIDRLDPRLYQYGGLWMYPVGALLKVGDFLGVIELKSDRAYYLDHPEAFGRFYVVARLYSVFWGCVAVLCLTWMALRMTGRGWVSVGIAMLFATSPMVMASAQEAKPHLAGCAMMLVACVCGWKWIDARQEHRRGLRWAILTGIIAGGAGAMVLSAVWAALIVPTMAWLGRGTSKESRRAAWQAFMIASAAGAVTFVVSNPFLVFNTLFRPDLVASNLGNSAAMYGTSGIGRSLMHAVLILRSGMDHMLTVLLTAVVIGLWGWVRKGMPRSTDLARVSGWLLVLPTATIATVVFVMLAGGKPMEYARFGLILSASASLGLAWMLRDGAWTTVWTIAFWVVTAVFIGSRSEYMPIRLSDTHESPATQPLSNRIGIYYEPAPWSLPPVDVFERELILYPRQAALGPEPSQNLNATREDPKIFIYPSNLSSQLRSWQWGEEISWRLNRWNRAVGPVVQSVHRD